MARQNARRKKSNRYTASARPNPFSGIFWLILGLLAGLLIATIFYLKQQHLLMSNNNTLKISSASHSHTHAVQHREPQFDFYHILPNSKKEPVLSSEQKEPRVTLQEPEVKSKPLENNSQLEKTTVESLDAENSVSVLPEVKENRYMLQIASVRHYEDADKLKAQLSLMGFSVTIQKINSGDIMLNRVVIGPYDSIAAAQEQQKRLRENNISSIVVKLASAASDQK